MWLLECDGDLLGGKKLWLKPGSKYLFGRTHDSTLGPNEHLHVISNKSVSRKHLVFAVDPVEPGSGNQIYKKSILTITDESKLGTTVDGQKLVKESRLLSGKEHKIRMGSYEQIFHVTWHPVVLTIHFSDRELKRNPDLLEPIREKLERFDIKTILPYIIDATTHFVCSKRNSPKSLQALINGKYIVTEGYIDALIEACSASQSAGDGTTALSCQMEEDFKANWPDALKYLPGPGKEPHPRPAEKFAPNSDRINVFEGFTFIFGEQADYRQLQAALTNGGAKALLFEIQFGETTTREFVKFVRNVAENKGLQDINDSNTAKGVIVVRFRGSGEAEQWTHDFLQRADLDLGQRSVEKSEFLDAILQNDARPLKRALEEDTQMGRLPMTVSEPTTRTEPNDHAQSRRAPPARAVFELEYLADQAMLQRNPVVASKGKFRRLPLKNRFKGFNFDDDDDDDDDNTPSVNGPKEAQSQAKHFTQPTFATRKDSSSLFVGESQNQDSVDGASTVIDRTSRKRPRDETEPDDDAMLRELMPGAVAAKKQRLAIEAEEAAAQGGSARASPQRTDLDIAPVPVASKRTTKKLTRTETALEVREAVRSHALKLEQERGKAIKQHPDDQLAPEDIEKLRNLAVVEEVETAPRQRPTTLQGRYIGYTNGINEQWDHRWNGLKNFKNFRRKGEATTQVSNRGRRVFIGLEECKSKDYGVSDKYWREQSGSSREGAAAREQSESQGQTRRNRRPRQTINNPAPVQIDFDDDSDEYSDEAGPMTMAARNQNAANAKKRPATDVTSQRQPPEKRARTAQVLSRMNEDDDDSSDDDDVHKFKFKRN